MVVGIAGHLVSSYVISHMKRILFLFFSFVLLCVMAVQAQVTFSVSTKRVSPT